MDIKRLLSDTSGSYFLFGPRGTGKTTWLMHQFPDALVLSLLDGVLRRELRAFPEHLESYIAQVPAGGVVVVDEIQRAPGLLDTIHGVMDSHRDLRFIMTGSSARKLKRNINADLLGGRAARRLCHPFLACEMGKAFQLDEALRYGMIPLVRYPQSGTSADVLRNYLGLYLEEEVATEGIVRNLDSFARFLQVASFSQASVLSVSAIAREAGVKRTTVDAYFNILDEMLITTRLPVFTRRAKRLLVGHDKFYFFDVGVFRALRPKGPLDNPNEIDGACLEGLVFQQLRAWNDYLETPNELYYWRTKNGVEVDFIVYGEKCFTAIEVKNSSHVERSDAMGLEAFRSDYPEAETILLYRGKRKLKVTANVTAIPVDNFLLSLDPSKNISLAP